eukprot:jgi/Chlat1/7330/Chrsp59S06948
MSFHKRQQQMCPECKEETEIAEDHSAGDMICTQCGLVLEARAIDESSEWRTFTNESPNNDPVRVGGPLNPLLSDGGLSTVISKTGGGADAANLSRWSNRSSNPDRNLINAFKAIAGMAERLNLVTTIKDRANEIYKQIEDMKSIRGRSQDVILAACLYTACRQEEMPRTFKGKAIAGQICSVAKASKTEVGRCYKLIVGQLNQAMGTIRAEDYLRRFCSHLGLSHDVIRAATTVAERAKDIGIATQKSPISVAAAVIFMVAQLSDTKKAQKDVSMVTGVSEVTIRNAYKDLYPRAGELLPEWFASPAAVKSLPAP